MPVNFRDPPFEPMNSVLQDILSPMATTIVGTYGADQNENHTDYSLASSTGNSLMVLTPGFNHSQGWRKTHYCNQLVVSNKNAEHRYTTYGKQKGCPAIPRLDLKVLKIL